MSNPDTAIDGILLSLLAAVRSKNPDGRDHVQVAKAAIDRYVTERCREALESLKSKAVDAGFVDLKEVKFVPLSAIDAECLAVLDKAQERLQVLSDGEKLVEAVPVAAIEAVRAGIAGKGEDIS